MLKNSKNGLTRDFFNIKYIDKTAFYGIMVVRENAHGGGVYMTITSHYRRAHFLHLLRKLNTKTLDTCLYLCYNLYITRAGELGLDFEGSW